MILPEHLEYMRRSGLTYETIAAMKCRSLTAEEIAQILPEMSGLLEFPYPGLNDFSRYKIFSPRHGGQQYYQKPGTGCHLYILDSIRKDLTDASVPLHFTDGEKKAAAGVQLGLAMIGLGGRWNLGDTETRDLISELSHGIAWAGRKVYLYPDSDVWSHPDLLKAVYSFGMEIDGMGADVEVVQLLQSGTKKVGLDDYLLGDGNEQSSDAKSRLIRRQEKALNLKHQALSQFKDWYVAKKKERHPKKNSHGTGPALQREAIIFAPIEPWPHVVDGAQLVKDIIAADGRFVVMQYYERIAVAFWILHSHAHSAADCSPILTHLSPTPGCGKTQALGVTKRLVPKPLATSNCSVSAIFRCIEAHQPTLLIDEGDTFFSLDQALRGILNSGHTRTAAYVLRKERQFSTWSPKILAAIGRLPLTIMQRSIIIHMRKRKQSEPVERFLDRREYPELEELRRKAARWAADNLTALEQAPEPSFPSNMDDRAVGNWIPLFTIADAIGAEWPRKVREAAQQFKSRSGTTPQVVELLADIRDFFAEKGIDRIWSADLVAALKELDGRPWKEANRGKALTTNYLANQLGEFDIHPDTVRIGIKTKKGYMLDWFRDAFERYLINE